jgi:predicted amidohydrolase YtcJ
MGVFQPEQAITPLDALRMWTVWAAGSMGEADVKGSIAPGKFADMTVFSDDILTIDPHRIQDASVLRTIVAGDTVYTAK